jgi:hypothetical protein
MNVLFSKVSEAIDGTFEDCVDDLINELRNTISEGSKDLFTEAWGKVNDSEKTGTREKDGFLSIIARLLKLGGYEKTTTVSAGAVKGSLGYLLDDLQENLINPVENAKKEWKLSVQKKVTSALTEAVDDVDLIDFTMLKTALRRLVNNMKLPYIDLREFAFDKRGNIQAGSFSGAFFTKTPVDRSYSGDLAGDEASAFIGEAQSYLGELRTYYRKQTEVFIEALEQSAKREKMSKLIFADLQKQLATLEAELGNKKLTLGRLKECLAALSKV